MCNIWISELTPSFKLRNRRFTNNEMSVFQTRIKEILASADSFRRQELEVSSTKTVLVSSKCVVTSLLQCLYFNEIES